MSNKEVKAAYFKQLSEAGLFRGPNELVIGPKIYQPLDRVDMAIMESAKKAWENHPLTLYERRDQLGSWRLNSITEFESAAKKVLGDFPRSQEQVSRIRAQNAELLRGAWQDYKGADSFSDERVATRAEVRSLTAVFKSWWEEVRGGNPNEEKSEQGETRPAKQLFAIESFLLSNVESMGICANEVVPRVGIDNRTHWVASEHVYKIDLRMQMQQIRGDLNKGQSTGLTGEQYAEIQDRVAANSASGEVTAIVYKIYKTGRDREQTSDYKKEVLSTLDFEGVAIFDSKTHQAVSQIIAENPGSSLYLKTEYRLTPQGFEKVVTYPRPKDDVKPLEKVILPSSARPEEKRLDWVREIMPLSPEDFLLVTRTYLTMSGLVHKSSNGDGDGGSRVLVGVK